MVTRREVQKLVWQSCNHNGTCKIKYYIYKVYIYKVYIYKVYIYIYTLYYCYCFGIVIIILIILIIIIYIIIIIIIIIIIVTIIVFQTLARIRLLEGWYQWQLQDIFPFSGEQECRKMLKIMCGYNSREF